MDTQLLPPVADDYGRPPRRRVWPWLAGGLAVVVVAAVAGVTLVPVGSRVAPGTTVAGVAVGGLDEAALRSALAGPVTRQVSRAVSIRVGDETVEVQPARAGITLDEDATAEAVLPGGSDTLLERWRAQAAGDVAAVVKVDRKKATAALTAATDDLVREPQDAKVQLAAPTEKLDAKGDTSWSATDVGVDVTPAVDGQGVDVGKGVRALTTAVRRGETALELPLVTTKAKLGTGEMEGVDQLIGTFTTYHPCCAPRVTNIHRIAEIVDGSVIAPGDSFSLNGKVGRRTAENGFVSAPAIADGELTDQLGGGVSQFSTTLFNAAWFAGITIDKHQPHSKYISRYPPGREATLDYDTIDQVLTNDTEAPIVIRTATTGTSVTVGLYGHTGDRTVSSVTGEEIPRTGGGFSVSVTRTVEQNGSMASRDTVSWSYTGLD